MRYLFLLLLFYSCIDHSKRDNNTATIEKPRLVNFLDKYEDRYLQSGNDVLQDRVNDSLKMDLSDSIKADILSELPMKIVDVKKYDGSKYAAHLKYDKYNINLDVIILISGDKLHLYPQSREVVPEGKFIGFIDNNVSQYTDQNIYSYYEGITTGWGKNLGVVLLEAR